VALTFISAPISIDTANAQQSATEREAYAFGVDRTSIFFLCNSVRHALERFLYRGIDLVEVEILAGLGEVSQSRVGNRKWSCFHKIGSILALLMVGFARRTQTA
jgi:hypothetical protein